VLRVRCRKSGKFPLTPPAALPAAYLRAISSEEIVRLPIRRYEGEVRLVTTAAELARAVEGIGAERVLGFDTETRPAFRKGESHLPALVQVATENAVLLFPLQRLDCSAALAAVLAAPAIVKAGVSLAHDLRQLKILFPFVESSMLDLGLLARRHGLKQTGLRNLAAIFLGIRIPKGNRTSNWAAPRLSAAQIGYAATDAWACRELYRCFERLHLLDPAQPRPPSQRRKNGMTYRIETVSVRNSPMEVFRFDPAGAGPHPGIVLCQHIPVGHTGVENDTVTLKVAERYAENGYAVAVPFIFHWWPKSAEMQLKRDEFRDDRTKLDLDAAFELLASARNVDAGRIGIVGHCWGGRVAWLGAGTNPRYKACAVFYGGRVKLPMGEGTPPAIDLAPQIRCPVIGFFGNDDTNPSPEDVNDYDAALTKAGVEHVFHRYDGAGHAFQSFNSEERYRHAASEDAWAKVLEFLAVRLKKGQ